MHGAFVAKVAANSIASYLGLTPGTRILKVNEREIRDVPDFLFEASGDRLLLETMSPDGTVTKYDIEKDYDDMLGIEFRDSLFDSVMMCENNCVFCFVKNLPKGLRSTLYMRDDDYRLSFMHGNFITLTNLKEQDFERIKAQRLSPLYVSVHSTNPEIRRTMMRNRESGDLLEHLKRLVSYGISFHLQIVAVPGYNDGPDFERTLFDLKSLGSAALSIGVVPVGLTKHCRYPGVGVLSAEECASILDRIEVWRKTASFDRVYPSDEFYIKADRSIPDACFYEDYPQLENGIGMVRLFLDEAAQVSAADLSHNLRIGVLTSRSFEKFMRDFLGRYASNVSLITVDNEFFGPEVTVAGLMTGRDIERAVIGYTTARDLRLDVLLLPAVCLNGDKFLDDVCLEQLSRSLNLRILALDSDPRQIHERIVRP